jgi:hypothetical protein
MLIMSLIDTRNPLQMSLHKGIDSSTLTDWNALWIHGTLIALTLIRVKWDLISHDIKNKLFSSLDAQILPVLLSHLLPFWFYKSSSKTNSNQISYCPREQNQFHRELRSGYHMFIVEITVQLLDCWHFFHVIVNLFFDITQSWPSWICKKCAHTEWRAMG